MRRHPQPDNDIEPDDADDLQQAFALLLPIRRQRLRRSERQQRETERALREAENHRLSAETALENGQQAYQTLREGFADRHQAGVQKQEQLMQGLAQERHASEAVARQRGQLARSHQTMQDQQHALRQAQQETQARLRDVEKLEYLMQQSEALR